MTTLGDREPTKAHSGYLGAEVTKAPDWHGLVTLDLLLNNLTTGLFLAAAVGELARPALIGPVARLAYPIALVALLADLLCLVVDLGNPTRFHHMLRVFKPTSPMSLGVWSLTAYSLPLTLVVAIDLLGWLGLLPSSGGVGLARGAILALGLLPAFGSAIYKGVLFSTSSQPGWKDARWLGAYLVSSALMYGAGGLYALAILAGLEAAGPLRWAFAALVATNLVPLGLLAAGLHPALARVHHRGGLYRLGALAAGVGVLGPLALVLASGGEPAAWAALGGLVLGGLAWRHAIVMLPHGAPHGAGSPG
ncbi:Polysulfide reductase, NrfD [Aquisphaera giovannonii]|uniref:Polysulfide reductase, NrfD n=1 Tax=Aquisphaera giovannonii TaxID=406548 RepID=A0A5B9VVK3_9BACT|nr:NrfD/PsrC family molybdoenzyme membrane anchor subunit [Aquisphaera giovannonii]QEH31740.1 Polysulfide reductase, NrfD [Aquisphaera giovannonii]